MPPKPDKRTIEEQIEAQARGEQPRDTPAEQGPPSKAQLDKRKSKGGGGDNGWPSF